MSDTAGVFVGLVVGTILLVVGFDPILSQAFAQPLSNPAFANSAAAPLWMVLSLIFQFHVDIIAMWAAFIRGAAGGR